MKFEFAKWLLQKENTSCSGTSGGGSYTNSIAVFARPFLPEPVRRGKYTKNKKK